MFLAEVSTGHFVVQSDKQKQNEIQYDPMMSVSHSPQKHDTESNKTLSVTFVGRLRTKTDITRPRAWQVLQCRWSLPCLYPPNWRFLEILAGPQPGFCRIHYLRKINLESGLNANRQNIRSWLLWITLNYMKSGLSLKCTRGFSALYKLTQKEVLIGKVGVFLRSLTSGWLSTFLNPCSYPSTKDVRLPWNQEITRMHNFATICICSRIRVLWSVITCAPSHRGGNKYAVSTQRKVFSAFSVSYYHTHQSPKPNSWSVSLVLFNSRKIHSKSF